MRPLIAVSTGNAVVFWLFARALFDEAFKLRRWHALLWAGRRRVSLVNCMWMGRHPARGFSIVAVNLVALGFIALAVAQTIASWSADLVERRRGVRGFIVIASALYGGMNAVLQIFPAGSEVVNAVNSAVLAGVVATICYAMMRVDGADLFPVASEIAPVTMRRSVVAAEERATKSWSMR